MDPAPLELDSPSHSSLSGLKLMAKSWETWREEEEGRGQLVHPLAQPVASAKPHQCHSQGYPEG